MLLAPSAAVLAAVTIAAADRDATPFDDEPPPQPGSRAAIELSKSTTPSGRRLIRRRA